MMGIVTKKALAINGGWGGICESMRKEMRKYERRDRNEERERLWRAVDAARSRAGFAGGGVPGFRFRGNDDGAGRRNGGAEISSVLAYVNTMLERVDIRR